MASITDLLQNTLDLIGAEANQPTNNVAQPQQRSAASILLEERRKNKRTFEEEDYVAFHNNQERNKNTIPINLPSYSLLNQISNSVVEPPKYQSSAVKPSSRLKEKKVEKSKKQKIAESRGQQYMDRLSNKAKQKNNKEKIRNQLKHA